MDIKEQLDKAITMQELASNFGKALLAETEKEVVSCYDKYNADLSEKCGVEND